MDRASAVSVCDRLSRLRGFARHTHKKLAIVERKSPIGAAAFFETLLEDPFAELWGRVRLASAAHDIDELLRQVLSEELLDDAMYETWLADLVDVVAAFGSTVGEETVSFWLGSDRGCVRFHVDIVPFRALVTYAGKGTEWLPEHAVDRLAFKRKLKAERIVCDPTAVRFLSPWDVALFRGGEDGVVHRTPAVALETPTLLLRLDRADFYDKFHGQGGSDGSDDDSGSYGEDDSGSDSDGGSEGST